LVYLSGLEPLINAVQERHSAHSATVFCVIVSRLKQIPSRYGSLNDDGLGIRLRVRRAQALLKGRLADAGRALRDQASLAALAPNSP